MADRGNSASRSYGRRVDVSRPKPTVVIADDDLPIRQDFRKLFEHDGRFEVVGLAHDGVDLVELVKRLRPDVAVVDVRMPRATGITATQTIVNETDTAVLIATTFDLDRDVQAAIRAGAAGFLLKSEAADHLVDAAAAVADGQQVYNATAIGAMVDALTDESVPEQVELAGLSEREIEVLRLLATGQSNADIGGKLHLSVSTVRTHVRNILPKIEAKNRTQAVVWAYENRVVRPGTV